MTSLTLDPGTTALVLIDLQRGIASLTTQPYSSADVIANAAQLAARFRERGALVVLVTVDPGPRGVLGPRPIADVQRPPFEAKPGYTDIVPELHATESDVRVTKHQPGAFHATDLDLQLRRRRVDTIVIGGISTNIGVESTARAGYDLGYNFVFVEDAMAARDAELHAFAVRRYFPTIGRVRTTRDVLDALR
jgi:nicotinamidase-related amidase